MSQTISEAPQSQSATAPVSAPAESTAADASGAAASVTEQEPGGPLQSAEDIAAFFDGQEAHQSGQEAEEAHPDGEGQGDAAEEKAEGSAAEEKKDAVAAPESWTKEEKEAFAKMPADLQHVVSRREAQRDAFVKTKAEEASQARRNHDQLLQWARSNLDQAVATAHASILGDYQDLDMIALQRERPDLYNQVDAEIKGRVARLQAVQARAREMEAYRMREEAGRNQQMTAQEAKKVPEIMAAVYGKENMPAKKAWMTEAEKFLTGMGMPKEHLHGLSHAYQIGLIAKAMKYDKMQAHAASAAQKVAAAPRVMRPASSGAPFSEQTQKQKAAWENMRRNPGSTESIAGLLDSLE